jgi:hypothetical protein
MYRQQSLPRMDVPEQCFHEESMSAEIPATDTSEHAVATLTVEEFPGVCRRLVNLSFPMAVADVLELRYLINHATDRLTEPQLTPDYREFREKLLVMLDGFEINRPHHRERLVRVIAMLRELHVAHSLKSRDEEVRIRLSLANIVKARAHSTNYGRVCLALMAVGGILWFGMNQPGWIVKLGTAAAAWFALDNFQSLPTFERETQRLNTELNEVLRQRIAAVDWKTLVNKLSLILGLRQHSGIEVFRIDSESPDRPTFSS